jgi:hypothetical protein
MIRNYTNSRQKPQLRVEILITVLGILGVITFFSFYETAFPDASVAVSISRRQAKQIATDYLKQFGFSMEGYDFALSFLSDAQAAYYLQRTLGIEEFNSRLANETWPLYYWSARWFRPLEKEEFRVYLMPDGKLMGLSHTIKEEASGINVPQAEAQSLAESFLAQHLSWKADQWERVEASSQTQPGGRVDHTFSWKSNMYAAGESELRYTVIVQGNRVGDVDSFIKVPEAFTRQYASERDLAEFISTVAYILLLFGCVIISMIAVSLSRPDLRRAIIPALLVAGVALAAYLNSIPLYKAYYDTTENYLLYWVTLSIGIFFSVLFSTLQALLLLLGAHSLSKYVWPRQDRILARGADQWIDFSRSAWRGLMLGGVQMAYVVFFYTITTTYLGWWSPVTSEYSDIFATPFPFFYAFEVGLSAALIEELAARFIGIGFLLWLFRGKYTWLAVLIPSLFWAFAHTSYVTFPIYARGIELILVALFLSFIFLKFDLLTSIMSHFTYNMMIMGIILLRSREMYYQISGWIVVLALALPLLPGLYRLLRRYRRGEPLPPENLTLSPLTKADLAQLSILPVKADWQILAQQANRTTLCLHANTEIVGFVTGYVDDQKMGYVDGVYVTPKWRRQYWGTTLLDAIYEFLEKSGTSQVRILVRPNEHRTRSFLHNLFWRTGLHVLTKAESESVFKTAVKTLFQDLKPEKSGENELEIPRNLIQ